MRDIRDRILEIVNQILVDPIKIYSLLVKVNNKHFLIDLSLDNLGNRYGSVSIDECSLVSSKLKNKIETDKILEGDYTLKVSSAGADRELKLPEDLNRFREIPLELQYKSEDGKTKNGVFRILSLENENLLVESLTKKKEQNFLKVQDIIKGKIYIQI